MTRIIMRGLGVLCTLMLAGSPAARADEPEPEAKAKVDKKKDKDAWKAEAKEKAKEKLKAKLKKAPPRGKEDPKPYQGGGDDAKKTAKSKLKARLAETPKPAMKVEAKLKAKALGKGSPDDEAKPGVEKATKGKEAAMARKARRAEQRAQVKKELGELAKKGLPPEVMQQQKRHARRMAKLMRIREIAEKKGKTKIVARVDKLMDKEKKRHHAFLEKKAEKPDDSEDEDEPHGDDHDDQEAH